MAKFNTFWIHAENETGNTIIETTTQALSRESAWHKAVELAFDAIEEGTGDWPETITVARHKAASESHG